MAIVRDASGNSPIPNTGLDPYTTTDAVHRSVSVTPSDSTNLSGGVTAAVLVAAAGDVKVTYVSGESDTIYLAAGIWHPMNVKRIWSTGTAATGIRAGY